MRTYDTAGRLATMSGTGVDWELQYDALGRLVRAQVALFSLAYALARPQTAPFR